MANRVRQVLQEQSEQPIKGLPAPTANKDTIDPDYPMNRSQPPDMGYTAPTMVTGSGNGPIIGLDEQQGNRS